MLRRTCSIPDAVESVLCALTVAEETGFAFGVPELMELFSVRISKTSGTFTIYPNFNRNLVYDFPEKDSGWMDRYFFFRITRSPVGEMLRSIAHALVSGSGTSWSPPLLKRPWNRPLPSTGRRRRGKLDLRLWRSSRKKKSRPLKLAEISPRVSLVADWVLQRTPDELNVVVALPCPEDDGEEEEGLERRKRKRSSDDVGMYPRADVRTRSKSADLARATESAMRPPTIRSDRSAQESDPPEESEPHVEESAEGGQEVAPIEEETAQPGTGLSEEVEVEGQT
ncbi:unnamed protein product [Cochlearia groenlandica]